MPMPSPMPPKPASSWCDSSFMLSESAWSGRAPIPESVDAIVGPVIGKGGCCEGVILTPQVHFFEKRLSEEEVMRRLLVYFVGLAAVLLAGGTIAQGYPTKPVKLIVTYPPGGSSDLMARVFGQKLSEIWGKPVIVESKPGAAGSIGMEYAAKQPNDGYSFVVGNIQPAAVNPLMTKVPYDVERDFVAISLIATGPNVLIVHPSLPAKSFRELIDFAKSNPGKLNYGSSGPGSVSQLAGAMLQILAGVKAVEVPYKGGILAVQDL